MKKNIGYLLFIGIALVALTIWSVNRSQTRGSNYTVFSARERGVSLLYDTLQHMGYPVAAGQAPLDGDAPVNDAFIIICPNDPDVNFGMAEEMLAWVRRGGRLIYLDEEHPTLLDYMVLGSVQPTQMGIMSHYNLGRGELVTGLADVMLNGFLMHESGYGQLLQDILEDWDAEQIWFAEYYHGYRVPEDFFTQLPLAVKLAGYQLAIITAAIVWCLGKRFGKPVPFYEETEREENEHVKALARLYRVARRRG